MEDLVITKGGPKLADADPNDPDAEPIDPLPSSEPVQYDKNGVPKLSGPGKSSMPGADHRNYVVFRAQPLYSLVRLLEWTVQKPVVDKTGLTGRYDYAVESFSAADTTPLGRLGLKLVPAKEPLRRMLVIDRAEKIPTDN